MSSLDFKIINTQMEIVTQVENNELVWRTYDGSANNLRSPLYGKAGICLDRKSAVDYSGSQTSGVAVRGALNPSPRLVSNEICQGSLYGGSPVSSAGMTDMTWIWGQFVDHEIDITPTGAESLNMSTDDGGVNEPWPGRTISFTRSESVVKSGVRQQPNAISSFIDASNVYGSSTDRAYALRLLDGSGKMKTGTADNNEVILPYNTEMLPNAPSTGVGFFIAGDVRANENVGLTSMHTVFMREHNRLCDVITADNPSLVGQDETIFQYARRLVAGMMQHITYNEFLPALLGGFSIYPGYSTTTSPNILTEFSTAGYRLGHTMLSDNIQIGESAGSLLSLVSAFFNPSYIQTNGINNILIGSSLKKMQEIDNIVVEAVRSFLFGPPAPPPAAGALLDLAALNMQRGRDHGLPGYNAVRVAYGLSSIASFGSLPMPSAVRTRLSAIYNSPSDIDPWIGVISENHIPGKAVGPLANAIIVDQFTRLRDGDRYWFENDPAITVNDRIMIQSTMLSDILSRNTEYLFNMDVFHI